MKAKWLITLKLILYVTTVALIFGLGILAKNIFGGGLTDFTKTGMTFIQKGPNGQVLIDLTPLFRVSGYSAQNPETKEFTLKDLKISPEIYNECMAKDVEGATRELKKRGKNEEMALPAFKIISRVENEKGEKILVTEGFKLLTNSVVVIAENTTQEELCRLVESLTPGCIIEQTVGNNAFEITMSLQSSMNPMELVTALSGRDEIKFCAPLFIQCGPDGEVLEENPTWEPLKKELPKFNI